MKKIVVYSPSFFPVLDGTSIQARRLYDLLLEDNAVYGLTFAVNRNMVQDVFENKDGIIRIPPKNKNVGKFPVLDGEEVTKKIKDISPDILHIRGWYQFGVVNDMLSSGYDGEIYWHPDGIHESHAHFSNNDEYLQIINKAIKKNVNFIANSEADINLFLSLNISRDKIYFIPPIVKNLNAEKEIYEHPKILTVARFFPYKGHLILLEAFQKSKINGELILAGAADSIECEETINKLKSLNAVLVINPDEKKLDELYNWATHHVLASTRESLGVSTLEGVCANCIPLARKIGGISSYLDDDFLFNDNNELQTKLRYLSGGNIFSELNYKLNDIRMFLGRNNVKRLYLQLHEVSK